MDSSEKSIINFNILISHEHWWFYIPSTTGLSYINLFLLVPPFHHRPRHHLHLGSEWHWFCSWLCCPMCHLPYRSPNSPGLQSGWDCQSLELYLKESKRFLSYWSSGTKVNDENFKKNKECELKETFFSRFKWRTLPNPAANKERLKLPDHSFKSQLSHRLTATPSPTPNLGFSS